MKIITITVGESFRCWLEDSSGLEKSNAQSGHDKQSKARRVEGGDRTEGSVVVMVVVVMRLNSPGSTAACTASHRLIGSSVLGPGMRRAQDA